MFQCVFSREARFTENEDDPEQIEGGQSPETIAGLCSSRCCFAIFQGSGKIQFRSFRKKMVNKLVNLEDW